MVRQTYILVIAVAVVVFSWLLLRPAKNDPSKKISKTSIDKKEKASPSFQSSPVLSLQTNQNLTPGVANPPDVSLQVKSAAVLAKNVPVNFWGKVVDQDEKPLAGAAIRMSVRQWRLNSLLNVRGDFIKHTKETGPDGLFELRNEEGDVLTVETIQKKGYELSPRSQKNFGYNISTNIVPNPNNPIIFKMWKKGEPQALISHRFSRVGIPCDGTPVFFDLTNGKKTPAGGDLKITLVRNPRNLASRKERYDWIATLEIPGGGLIESNDEFMYFAPEYNYTQILSFEVKKDAPDWTPLLNKQFYIKIKDGTIFGKLSINLSTDYQPPPAGLTMGTSINPSGSRNLEYDPAAQPKQTFFE